MMPAIRNRGVSRQVRKTILTPMFGAMAGPRIAVTKFLGQQATVMEHQEAEKECRLHLQGMFLILRSKPSFTFYRTQHKCSENVC